MCNDVSARDLLLTGTPAGTALRAPPVVVERIGSLLPDHLKWRIFFRREERNPDYFRAGDVITASVAAHWVIRLLISMA